MENNENNENSSSGLYTRILCVISELFKKKTLIFCCMLLCAITVDMVRTALYRPQYEAYVTATVSTEKNTYADLEGTRDYITTLDYILNGQIVKKYVAEHMGIDSVKYQCQVSSASDTNIIKLKIRSDSQKDAYFSLNHIINWYTENATKMKFQYQLRVLDRPSIREQAVKQNSHFRNFMIGFLLSGIAVGGILAFFEFLRETVKVPKDIERYIECRLYAKIPREKNRDYRRFSKRKKHTALITSMKTGFAFKESFKKLRRRVEESAKRHGYQVFMITSALENEGKSSIAANLALALSRNGHKVLLVDGDLRKPAVHKILETGNKKSVNAYLNGRSDWQSLVKYIKKHQLYVMTAQKGLQSFETVFTLEKWKMFFEQAKQEFDYIIVDSSPAAFLNEPIILNGAVDATLLIVKQNMATCKVINDTIDRLLSAKNNLIGCIFNASLQDWTSKNHSYGYQYGYDRYKQRQERGT